MQGMLQHTLLKEADRLDGMYAQALNRIYNQVNSPWQAKVLGCIALHALPLPCPHASHVCIRPSICVVGSSTQQQEAGLQSLVCSCGIRGVAWQVAGSEWKLVEEGKNPDLPQDEEPRFSTWEEATGRKEHSQSGAQASTSGPNRVASKDRTYYK